MDPLRGVVVGAGYFSQFHLDAWSRLDSVDITTICDLNLDQAKRAAGQWNVATCYTDFTEALDREKPDFVDVVTRPDSHLMLVQEAVRRDVAVICQKPLAPTFEEARQIVELASDAEVPLMIHENFRFQPWHREIKRLLNEEVIGDRLHSIYFRCRTGDGWQKDAYLNRQPYFRTMPRLMVFETGVHFVDTFRYLGGEIAGVYASVRRLNPEIVGEDAATVLFELSSGAEAIWDGNRFNESAAEDPRYTFGEALVEANGGSIRLYPDGRLTVQCLGERERDHPYVHEKRGFGGDCVFATQRHFIECLRNGTTFETSGSEYLKTMRIVEAVYQSANQRQPIRQLADGGTA